MNIILKEDVRGLGYKNDLVKVKPGYGRNFLIPKGLAVIANESNVKMRNEDVRQAQHKQERIRQEAQATAEKLNGVELTIGAKACESGKIFGSVTNLQIADALAAKGITVDRRRISFKTDIKHIGSYEAEIDLHREVKAVIKFEVVSE